MQPRRWWTIPLGAGLLSGVVTEIVILVHGPFGDAANEAYSRGEQVGIVMRYAVLGFLLALAVEQALLAARGSTRMALWGAGAVAVLAAMVLPPALAGDGGPSARDARRAGFVDGCTHGTGPYDRQADACGCIYDELDRNDLLDLLDAPQPQGEPPPEARAALVDAARVCDRRFPPG